MYVDGSGLRSQPHCRQDGAHRLHHPPHLIVRLATCGLGAGRAIFGSGREPRVNGVRVVLAAAAARRFLFRDEVSGQVQGVVGNERQGCVRIRLGSEVDIAQLLHVIHVVGPVQSRFSHRYRMVSNVRP